MKRVNLPNKTLIFGAGPAGLTAAYELVKAGQRPLVLEMADKVGGISRTETYKGYHFDIGGHRFYTKVDEVEAIWHELLPDDLLDRPRISRIHYDRKFFNYPIQAFDALSKLGILTSLRVALSYAASRLFPYPDEDSFEEWVSNRFGKKLYEIFFKTYTEKVWGIPCSEIRADWAAQRIKGLSLPSAVWNALFQRKSQDQEIKTLINRFLYPRLGPGMMWEAAAGQVNKHGGLVQLNSKVEKVVHDHGRVTHIQVQRLVDGRTEPERIEGSDFISSIPITTLIRIMDPAPPGETLQAAESLSYRDFLTVVLIVDHPHLFHDNWIYIHEPEIMVGRIQNFKNWSPEMVPDPSKTSLGLEYFCNAGDAVWTMDDGDLIALGTREVETLGLLNGSAVLDGAVVRQPKAYPVYDRSYSQHLLKLQEHIAGFENLQTIGRNGLHKYNNQDHSMLTGLLAARNLLGESHDLWGINTERSYYEEVRIARDALAADLAGLEQ